MMPVQREHSASQGAKKTTSSQIAQVGQETLPVVVPPVASAPAAAPKTKSRRWMWAVGGVLVMGLAGLFYLQPWATPAPVVMVETVALGPVTRVLAVNGRIAGVRSVDVRPLVSGTLVEVLVAEGDIVTRNQALMQLDTATQQAVVRQAVAGLDAAFVAQDDAVATLARTRTLGANVARVVLETAVRAEQAAAQEVARMTALLDQAQIQLEKFTIRAPIPGTVLVLNVDPGQSVDPATVLLSIADLGTLVVETDVDESYATQIRTGQPAALQLSGEAEVRAGHVSFVSQRVDEDTGGLVVRLTPDAPLTAPIGLTVTANITVDDRASAITVPRAAIISDAAADAVLVAVDGTAQRRAVEVIDWPAARLIVTDGLAPGDEVIADATGLTDGQAIQVAP
ncbi:MAG: efflux transporter periplasmic adaptor subunit [Rhodobacter sp.]|nr:efflux transporter periplasmic adaptor subunit [Rhodobacter sp.]